MLQLAVDIGNTAVKAALFEGDEIKHYSRSSGTDEVNAIGLLLRQQPVRIIISNVREKSDVAHFLASRFLKDKTLFMLDHESPLPIINAYSSPETLGKDRLSNVVGAFNQFPNTDCLVIDAGTCLKFDFINAKNEYLGGSIAPGYAMRFKALHNYTGKLPLVETAHPVDLVGDSTPKSIQSGVYNGMLAEIHGMMNRYLMNYKNLQCLLTGGDAEVFVKALKNPIFADPFLTLRGLNTILNQYA